MNLAHLGLHPHKHREAASQRSDANASVELPTALLPDVGGYRISIHTPTRPTLLTWPHPQPVASTSKSTPPVNKTAAPAIASSSSRADRTQASAPTPSQSTSPQPTPKRKKKRRSSAIVIDSDNEDVRHDQQRYHSHKQGRTPAAAPAFERETIHRPTVREDEGEVDELQSSEDERDDRQVEQSLLPSSPSRANSKSTSASYESPATIAARVPAAAAAAVDQRQDGQAHSPVNFRAQMSQPEQASSSIHETATDSEARIRHPAPQSPAQPFTNLMPPLPLNTSATLPSTPTVSRSDGASSLAADEPRFVSLQGKKIFLTGLTKVKRGTLLEQARRAGATEGTITDPAHVDLLVLGKVPNKSIVDYLAHKYHVPTIEEEDFEKILSSSTEQQQQQQQRPADAVTPPLPTVSGPAQGLSSEPQADRPKQHSSNHGAMEQSQPGIPSRNNANSNSDSDSGSEDEGDSSTFYAQAPSRLPAQLSDQYPPLRVDLAALQSSISKLGPLPPLRSFSADSSTEIPVNQAEVVCSTLPAPSKVRPPGLLGLFPQLSTWPIRTSQPAMKHPSPRLIRQSEKIAVPPGLKMQSFASHQLRNTNLQRTAQLMRNSLLSAAPRPCRCSQCSAFLGRSMAALKQSFPDLHRKLSAKTTVNQPPPPPPAPPTRPPSTVRPSEAVPPRPRQTLASAPVSQPNQPNITAPQQAGSYRSQAAAHLAMYPSHKIGQSVSPAIGLFYPRPGPSQPTARHQANAPQTGITNPAFAPPNVQPQSRPSDTTGSSAETLRGPPAGTPLTGAPAPQPSSSKTVTGAAAESAPLQFPVLPSQQQSRKGTQKLTDIFTYAVWLTVRYVFSTYSKSRPGQHAEAD